jgi:hypothetical protein
MIGFFRLSILLSLFSCDPLFAQVQLCAVQTNQIVIDSSGSRQVITLVGSITDTLFTLEKSQKVLSSAMFGTDTIAFLYKPALHTTDYIRLIRSVKTRKFELKSSITISTIHRSPPPAVPRGITFPTERGVGIPFDAVCTLLDVFHVNCAKAVTEWKLNVLEYEALTPVKRRKSFSVWLRGLLK